MKKNIYGFLFIINLFTLIIFAVSGCTAIKTVNRIKAGEIQLADNMEREISVKKSGHALMIKVHINESDKEYNFILDTGAITAVSKQAAKEIGVDKGIKIAGKDSAGNKKNISLIQLDSIAAADFKVNQCAAAIIDLSEIDPNIDGILGSNFLRFFKVTIDYQTQKVIFSNSNNPTEIYENTLQIPFQQDFKHGYAPVINCSIEEKISAKCIIDTGAPFLAGIPFSIMKKTEAFKNGNVIEAKGNMSGGAFGTDAKSFILLADKLNIGGFVINGAPLISNNAENDNLLIGERFLSNFTITIDYPNSKLFLTRNKNNTFKNDLESFGIAFNKLEGKTFVMGILPDSAADKAQIKLGDEVLKINSIKTKDLSIGDMANISRNNTELNLKYLSDNQLKDITLKKEKFFLGK